MNKERVYLTNIKLHARGYRQTVNFSKVAEKGRMYSPLPKDYAKNENSLGDGKFSLTFSLPNDLQKRIDSGEVELMMPKDGLYIYAGRDLIEFMKRMEQKKLNESIHRGGTWHGNKE